MNEVNCGNDGDGEGWPTRRYGNRNAQTVTAGTAPWSSATADVTTNRLQTGYTYDANGNMTNDGSNTIAYDGENRAITSSGVLGSGGYNYDGNNLRVKKCLPNCTSPTTTTVYVFSGSAVIAEYVNGAAPISPTREYIYSGGALLAKIESGATQYYHPDHLSARLMTDATGTKIGEQGHYPFGESWYATSTTTKWLFTTYERDAESGNDYAYARIYVNRLGRFSALDMVMGSTWNPQSLNAYSYVLNDPTNLVDPLGQCPNYGPFIVQGRVICTSAGILNHDPDSMDCAIDGIQASCQLAGTLLQAGAGIVEGFDQGPDPDPPCDPGAICVGTLGHITTLTWVVDPGILAPNQDSTPSWWGTFAKTFISGFSPKSIIKDLNDPKSCFGQFVDEQTPTKLIDTPALQDAVHDSAATLGQATAISYAGARLLTTPLRSSIVRGLVSYGERANTAFAVYGVAMETKAFINEMSSLAKGTCH